MCAKITRIVRGSRVTRPVVQVERLSQSLSRIGSGRVGSGRVKTSDIFGGSGEPTRKV